MAILSNRNSKFLKEKMLIFWRKLQSGRKMTMQLKEKIKN
jgi:hypothetical protein